MAGDNGVDFGLASLLAAGGFLENLTEGAGWFFGGLLFLHDEVLEECSDDAEEEDGETGGVGEIGASVEIDDIEEFGVEIIGDMGGVLEVALLFFDEGVDGGEGGNEGVGAILNIVIGARDDHGVDGGEEGDKNRNLN